MQGFMGFSTAEGQTNFEGSKYLEIKDQRLWFNILKLWGLEWERGIVKHQVRYCLVLRGIPPPEKPHEGQVCCLVVKNSCGNTKP